MGRLNVWSVCLSLVMVLCALAGCTLEDPIPGDIEHCGSPDIRCIDVLEHASKVECKDLRGVLAMRQDSQSEIQFQCSAVACADGYHTVEDGLVFKCDKNENMCDVAELCQSADGWQDGVCVKFNQTPTCISTACQAGYHLVPSTRACPEKRCMQNTYCSKDTEEHCGGVNIRCRIEIDGWESGSCEDAKCVVKSCATGRFASEGKDACPPITNEQCGSETLSCILPMKCDGVGQCVHDCNDGKTYCDSSGCVDTTSNTDHCGACGNACSIKEGTFADRMACSNSECVIASCEPGYYLDGSTCKENDDNNCGQKGKQCTVSNGTATCNSSTGTCEIVCNVCFSLSDGQCVRKAVGDEVIFGRYPQDEDSDTPSPLTWQILEINDDAALLISKYVLEQYRYHDKLEDITWEKSNVRSYLNGLSAAFNKNSIDHHGKGFIDKAFTADERKWIKQVTNKNPNAPANWNSTPGGSNTDDKVFLLSRAEALKYLATNKLRMASPTAYALHPPKDSGRINLYTRPVTCSSDNSCAGTEGSTWNNDTSNVQLCSNVQCGSAWCLRSPGTSPYYAAFVSSRGSVTGSYNNDDYCDHIGLRPALYVRLSSEF